MNNNNKLKESRVVEIMDLCDALDTVIYESSKAFSGVEVIASLNKIRALLPNVLHKLSTMDFLIDKTLKEFTEDNEKWKSIKHSSTVAIAIAKAYNEDVSKCKNRLEATKKSAEIASQQLTTILSYYKTELNNLN